jgi:hypothetical protein
MVKDELKRIWVNAVGSSFKVNNPAAGMDEKKNKTVSE